MEFVTRMKGFEVTKMEREARQESAIQGWKTRRDRQLLRELYALQDTREPHGAVTCPDDSVSFFERLYGLEDPRPPFFMDSQA